MKIDKRRKNFFSLEAQQFYKKIIKFYKKHIDNIKVLCYNIFIKGKEKERCHITKNIMKRIEKS